MKIVSPRDNISYGRYADEFIIRSGIWNHMEIVFSRSEFMNNESDFDRFIDLLEGSFEPDGVEEDGFRGDPYHGFLLDQMLGMKLVERRQVGMIESQDNSVKRIGILTEQALVTDAKHVFGQKALTIEDIEPQLAEQLLTKLDYQAYQAAVETGRQLFPFDRVIVLCTTPRITLLHKLNRLFYELSMPWSLALRDGSFITWTAFNRDYTGCFECLSQSNETRMQGLINFIRYRKEEDRYNHFSANRDDFLLMASFIKRLDSGNLYEIETPIEGRVLSIYLPSFEIATERLLRSPMCTTCGHVSVGKAQDYNLSTRKALKEVLGHVDA